MHEKPQRLPVRMLNGKWQVLLLEENKWLDCLGKVDALLIAGAKALEYDS